MCTPATIQLCLNYILPKSLCKKCVVITWNLIFTKGNSMKFILIYRSNYAIQVCTGKPLHLFT